MKTTLRVLLGFVLIFGMLSVQGFAGQEKFGQEISNRTVTSVKDILANPKGYDGKTVTISGAISQECSTGCWFYVKITDGNVAIYVDIGKSGFAIPQYVGKKVLVEGVVVAAPSGTMIQGKGVEVR